MKTLVASLFAVTVLGGSLLCGDVAAQQVYKWKDAKGVTHYSQTPPNGRAYQQQTVNARPATAAAAAPTAATAQAGNAPAGAQSNAACESARKNLALLQGQGEVQMDSNGDGEPDTTLDAASRARQITLAQAFLEANCSGAR